MRYGVRLNSMHVVEIVRRRRIGQARDQLSRAPIPAWFPPRRQVFSILVKFDDPRIFVAIGNKKCAIGQPGDIRLTVEMLVIVATYSGLADGLQQLFSIVRENKNCTFAVIVYPDALFRIVWT